MVDAPSGRAPERALERFLVATEACGGGTPDLSSVLIVWGYVGIYRRKEYVGGAAGGPRGREARPGGRALHPRDRLFCSLEQGPSLPDHVR